MPGISGAGTLMAHRGRSQQIRPQGVPQFPINVLGPRSRSSSDAYAIGGEGVGFSQVHSEGAATESGEDQAATLCSLLR